MNELITIIFFCSIPVILVVGIFSAILWSILICDVVEKIKRERRQKNNGTLCRHSRK